MRRRAEDGGIEGIANTGIGPVLGAEKLPTPSFEERTPLVERRGEDYPIRPPSRTPSPVLRDDSSLFQAPGGPGSPRKMRKSDDKEVTEGASLPISSYGPVEGEYDSDIDNFAKSALIDEDEDRERDFGRDEDEELAKELTMFSPQFWEGRCGKALSQCGTGFDAVVGRWIPKGGIFASVFELLSATLGAGTLSLPFAFKVSGVGLATILMFVGAIAAYYSIHLLVVSSDITRKKSYEDMTRAVFGRKVEILLDVSIIIFAWGSTVGYMVAIGDLVPQVLEMMRLTEVVHEWLIERWVIMTAVTLFVIFPLSLLKKLSSLRFTATLGFLATCYLVLVVFARTVESIQKDGFNPRGQLVYFDWGSGFFIAAPIIFYAYSSHVNIFSIYSELKHPTHRRINSVIFGDVILAFLVYAAIGLFGYLHFFSDTDSNILNNYPSSDIPVQLGALALVWSIIFNIPLNNHPCRITVDFMLFGPTSSISPTLRHWAETFVIVFLALIIAITVPNITTIFSLLGATATAFCCYIMPALIYLRVGGFKILSWQALPCLLLVFVATASSITSTVVIIIDIVS